MKKARFYVLYTLIGAVSYWVPDLLIHRILHDSLLWFLLLTLFVPAIVSLVYFLLFLRHPHSQYVLGLPLFMLLGIWLFGPLTVTLGQGSISSASLVDVLFMWAIFPGTTFMLATYSGSLGGLVITSCLLVIYSISVPKPKVSGGSPLPSTNGDPKPDSVNGSREWRVAVSLFLGVGITAASTVAAFWVESELILSILLWPVRLIVGLIPPLNIGTEEDPFYEGTPIDIFGAMLGLILSAIFYGGVVYLVLKVTRTFRGRRNQDN